MYAKILDIFDLWNLDSIQIDSRIDYSTRNECDINWLAFIDFNSLQPALKALTSSIWGSNYLKNI